MGRVMRNERFVGMAYSVTFMFSVGILVADPVFLVQNDVNLA